MRALTRRIIKETSRILLRTILNSCNKRNGASNHRTEISSRCAFVSRQRLFRCVKQVCHANIFSRNALTCITKIGNCNSHTENTTNIFCKHGRESFVWWKHVTRIPLKTYEILHSYSLYFITALTELNKDGSRKRNCCFYAGSSIIINASYNTEDINYLAH